jgi:hypothetical protein
VEEDEPLATREAMRLQLLIDDLVSQQVEALEQIAQVLLVVIWLYRF